MAKARSKGEVTAAGSTRSEFRKSNGAIGLRVVDGKLTLLNRKVFNVLMYHAQLAREPGIGAPIDTPASKKYFWVPLSELARDARYDSKDMQFLRKQLTDMQNIKLMMETDQQWTSERLIASVTFANPKGLHSQSGQVWVGFAFPPEVHENVMKPQTYTKLSILYQGVLRSGSALALYEICRRYATNPTKVTSIEPYEYWYGALTGNPVPDGVDLPPYKYFKRDTIKPAIAEINALTDIEIELVEHKNGRRVERLQFRIAFAQQPQLELPAAPLIDVELMQRVISLGFTPNDAADLVAEHGEAKIHAALSFVQQRVEAKNSSPLESPAAYFRWSLTSASAAAMEVHEKKVKPPKKRAEPDVMEMYMAARGKRALELFKEMDEDERVAVYERFKEQASGKVAPLVKVLDHGVSRTLLSMWYANDLWGAPNALDIAQFVQQVGFMPPQAARP